VEEEWPWVGRESTIVGCRTLEQEGEAETARSVGCTLWVKLKLKNENEACHRDLTYYSFFFLKKQNNSTGNKYSVEFKQEE
jgi:hypothetical protein